jgi:hypothetical protein
MATRTAAKGRRSNTMAILNSISKNGADSICTALRAAGIICVAVPGPLLPGGPACQGYVVRIIDAAGLIEINDGETHNGAWATLAADHA